MAVDERERMALREDLERTLGRDSAVTLMTMLPPTGWADVARQGDLDGLARQSGLDALERRVDARFAAVDARFDALEQRMDDRFTLADQKFDTLRNELLAAFRGELVNAVAVQTRTIVFAVVGAFTALGGLALTLARVL